MVKRKKKKTQSSNNFIYIFLLVIFILMVLYLNSSKISTLLKNTQRDKTKITAKELKEKITVQDAVAHSIRLLGIPDKNFSNHIGDDGIYISLGINKNEMDLNYANIIITGQVELIGGKLVSGKEINNGNKQILEFMDTKDSQKYIVTLYYTKSKTSNRKKTQLAIVVDDFGAQNDKLLDDFCKLDPNISFAILPDQKFSKLVMNKAVKAGHETLIHIPMEPVSYPKNNPGSHAIYVHLSDKEIRRRMERFIKQFPLCAGANNHMGSLATTDENVMRNVLAVLKKHNLYFVDSRTSQSSIAYKMAKKMMIPTIENHLFLDTPFISEKTLKRKIQQLKVICKNNNKILVITHCATIERYEFLKNFLQLIEELDLELVPVSKLFESELPEIL
jgi:polysaccharide deacetylase 2 family uncharacterized protein YibQ